MAFPIELGKDYKIPNTSFTFIRNPFAFKVYCYLCSKCDMRLYYVLVDLEEISKVVNISVGAVRRATDWLIREGYLIEVEGSTNLFKLKYIEEDY